VKLPPAVDQVQLPRPRGLDDETGELAPKDADLAADRVARQALEEVLATGPADQRADPPAQRRLAHIRSGALTPSSPRVVAIVRLVATQSASRAASAPDSSAPTTRQSR
jgi:hypothetical protein